ncbi:NAD-binding protein [Spirochaeta lutea]|nr:NAD-binding protein [Spirochaeta lutea]
MAKQLSDEGRQVTLIEKDPAKARYAQAQLDCMVLNDEGNNLTLLAKAGAADADFFISVTESDEMNLLSCGLVSGEFQKPKTIARVRNYDYSEATTWDNPLFGIDHIINSEIEVAREITNIIKHGVRSNIMTLENSSLQIRNLTIDEESPFKYKPLQELRSSIAVDFIAPFLLRMEEYIIPTGATRLLENDKLFILASESGFEAIFELAHKKPQGIRKIAFVGGRNVACFLADYLGDQQHDHISDTVTIC